jgi:flagellar hook-associated protein 2
MSTAPLRFSGISSFSADFQTIVDRAVAIAGLPVKALQKDQVDLMSRKAALASVSAAVAQLAKSLQDLGKLHADGGLAASVSSGKVTAALESGAQRGAWAIEEISALAQAAAATSNTGWPDRMTTAVAAPEGALELVVGNQTYNFVLHPGENHLQGVRDRINALGAGVTASILSTGGATPTYYLALSATETGIRTLELRTEAGNPASNLLTQNNPGANAVLRINGVTVEHPGNVISGAIEGVTLTLHGVTAGESITVQANPSRSALETGLSAFADSYNKLVQELDRHAGEAAGPLRGEALLGQLRMQLSSLAGHQAAGAMDSLASLGLVFDRNGFLALDRARVQALSAQQVEEALEFLGGPGGLASRQTQFALFSDPAFGLITQEFQSITDSDVRLTQQIAAMNERIAAMQTTLLARLQSADAFLAQLESQQRMLESSVRSLNLVLYGKQDKG